MNFKLSTRGLTLGKSSKDFKLTLEQLNLVKIVSLNKINNQNPTLLMNGKYNLFILDTEETIKGRIRNAIGKSSGDLFEKEKVFGFCATNECTNLISNHHGGFASLTIQISRRNISEDCKMTVELLKSLVEALK